MSFIRNVIKNFLLSRNAVISRPPGQFSLGTLKLRKWKERGLTISRVVDAGAAEGGWAREVREIYPGCAVLCVEPREDVQAGLDALKRDAPEVVVAKTLLGDQNGTVDFYEHADQSSMLPHSVTGEFGRLVKAPVETLDHLLERLGFGQPDLIKLDLQGAELKALAGATTALGGAQAVLTEVSFIPLNAGSALSGDVVAFLGKQGFRLVDVFALWHRPLDGAMAQGDFFFVREGHPTLKDTRWSDRGTWG